MQIDAQIGPVPSKRNRGDMIPAPMIRAMLFIVCTALAIVGASVLGGWDKAAVPPVSEILQERSLILEGGPAQSVKVREPDGTIILDLDHGSFITVIQSGLARARLTRNVEATLPVRLVSYANGRLAIHDDITGWSVELGAFGQDNRAAFAALLPNQ